MDAIEPGVDETPDDQQLPPDDPDAAAARAPAALQPRDHRVRP
jgi:hypothetical protein